MKWISKISKDLSWGIWLLFFGVCAYSALFQGKDISIFNGVTLITLLLFNLNEKPYIRINNYKDCSKIQVSGEIVEYDIDETENLR